MKILALDTATEGCSAALLIGTDILGRELELGRGHAERILTMIDGLLTEAAIGLGALDAIAFGRGPGGFTGVRLAASVTQGLAFGAGLPVIPVSDLQAVAQRALASDATIERVVVCNDARMQEVYWGCFERGADGLAIPVGKERVSRPDTVAVPADWSSPIHGAGRGFAAYPELTTRIGAPLDSVHDRMLPRAQEMALLAVPAFLAGATVAAEEAIPVYLRDDVIRAAGPESLVRGRHTGSDN